MLQTKALEFIVPLLVQEIYKMDLNDPDSIPGSAVRAGLSSGHSWLSAGRHQASPVVTLNLIF